MLMNPNKNKISSPKADIGLSDLNELNNINLDGPPKPKEKRPSFTDITSNIFSNTPKEIPSINLNINDSNNIKSTPLKQATTQSKIETEDGFKTFNEIPIAPSAPPPKPTLSPEEMLREKLKILRKLEELEKKGIQSVSYTHLTLPTILLV